MKTCKDCLHSKVCRDWWSEQEENLFSESNVACRVFTDRSEWVHLPSDDYTFRIRGDIAKGIIVANCRNAEKELKGFNEE
jgi:hypothetical protein